MSYLTIQSASKVVWPKCILFNREKEGNLESWNFLLMILEVLKISESEVTYSQVWWPILRIRALHLTHQTCTHTQQWTYTHTVNTHPEQWAGIYAAAPGEQLGVRCLAQGHLSRGIEGWESSGHSLPHLQFLTARDSNSQPFDYDSDSLTIRPQLPSWKMQIMQKR